MPATLPNSAYLEKINERDIERFWQNVNKDGPIVHIELGQCWEWTGRPTKGGYGGFRIGDQSNRGAHRIAYFLANGSLQEGMQVLHKCDNRKCVNPMHLFEGTQLDNMRDMIAKGRAVRGAALSELRTRTAARGEQNGFSKLTEQKVVEMRRRHFIGREPMKALANEHGINVTAAHKAITGRTWRHIK